MPIFTWRSAAVTIMFIACLLSTKASALAAETAPPLRLAYIQQNILYLKEANVSNPLEYKVSLAGKAEIIGWSHNGRWLAIHQWTPQGQGPYLWVVDQGGKNLQQVAPRPIDRNAGWSPNRVALAYITPDNDLLLTELVNSQWVTRELVPPSSNESNDLTWYPDGKALALAMSRTQELPLRIDKISLTGKRSRLATLKGKDLGGLGNEIFVRDLSTLTFSPNGRYLAAFLASNSSSYNEAGMPLSIIDTKNNHRVTVGKGLGYRGWLAWSKDSKKLAFINGLGRSATTNKRLYIAQVGKGKKVIRVGKKGLVDCRPCWAGSSVYFGRGTEIETWDTTDKRVPGQQIVTWKNGKVKAITRPGDQNSDLPLSLSPDGKNIAFLRLSSSAEASLYTVKLKTGYLSRLLDQLRGTGGYYGNFYPDWVFVYWPAN